MTMTSGVFKNFQTEVNISDQRHVHYLEKRLIPFSRTPFWEGLGDLPPVVPGTIQKSSLPSSDSTSHQRLNQGYESLNSTEDAERDYWNDEPVGERPPAWLELSADLAWTATFSSLTSNMEISSFHTVVSYAVFFALMWQLWAAQASYDIKFYTNDWWHRLSFILQLLVYGSLAAFTADFDAFWGLGSSESDVFVGDAEGLDALAVRANSERTKELSFQGIALIIAISRFLLLVQYIRVTIYRQKHKTFAWRYLLTPISLFISTGLFLSCFMMLWVCGPSQATSIVRFMLWGSAIIVEWLGHAFTPDDPKETLRGYGSLTGRLNTLTVIVMGEGLNGLCSTLRSTVNAVGFGSKMIAMIACAALMLYFYWLLYFDAFRERLPPKKSQKEVWLLLHLPFHLCLILFLEGMKNLLLSANVTISSRFFLDTLYNSGAIQTDVGFVPSESMSHLVQKLGLSWDKQVEDSKVAFEAGSQEGIVQWHRWVLTVCYNIYQAYDKHLDPKAVGDYRIYMTDDRYVLQDITELELKNAVGYGRYWHAIIHELDPFIGAVYWVIPIAGCLIMSIGLLNYAQSRPQDKYAWGSILTKCLAGLVLLLLTAVSAAKDSDTVMIWRMPMIVLTLAAVTIIEFTLLYISVCSTRRQQRGGALTREIDGDGHGSEYHGLRPLEQTQSRQPLIGNAQSPGQTATPFSETPSTHTAQAVSVVVGPPAYFPPPPALEGYFLPSLTSSPPAFHEETLFVPTTPFQQQTMTGAVNGMYPN